ncbi:hypothetical protein [Luteibacter sp. SG786]|uniref:hypothetical protein n=1 Tax=Luteibacter sp. SG786 TaxID=2587130 RepID=UPI001420CACD|nr:hypothetical protein [Luteibacter sp. SG786]NII54689.1 hypothetical protein [Luteibacter sp. SG786]
MQVRSFLFTLIAGASVLLAGCGEAVKRAPVPLEQSLLPATIYVPSCPPYDGFEGLPQRDWLAGDLSCRAMHERLALALQPVAGKVRIVDYAWSKDAERFAVDPDKAVESSIGSRYRVVLRPVYASRFRTPGLSPARPPGAIGGFQKELSVWEDLAVFSATTDEEIGEASLVSMQGGGGADEMAPLIAGGIVGARCQALNKFSLKAFGHVMDGCKTFALYPVD